MKRSQLKKIIREILEEGNFDELKKYQKMLKDAQDFFQKKSKELGVEKEYLDSGFVKATNDVIDAVFKANHKRTGGKIDENKLTESIFKKQ